MKFDDDDLRTMLSQRASRLSPDFVRNSSRDVVGRSAHSGRKPWSVFRGASAAVGAAVIIGLAVFIVIERNATSLPASTGQTIAPGIYQSLRPVGNGPIGSQLCVALNLATSYATATPSSVWWWDASPMDCRLSVSGVVPGRATLTPVALSPSGSLHERTGYRVQFEMAMLPSGTYRVAFTLDPAARASDSQPIPGFTETATGEVMVEFQPVPKLEIQEPGGTSIPTPLISPTASP